MTEDLFSRSMEIRDKVSELRQLIDDMQDVDEKIQVLNYVRKELHSVSPLKHHPTDYVEWVKSENVEGNSYNPNHVAPPEEKILLLSIHEDGYTMPVVTCPEPDIRRIVDGFHRRKIERGYKKISDSTLGYLPVTTIRQERSALADRIVSTIRHNRARGVHAVDGMVNIVKILLIDCGMSPAWIVKKIGMDADELLRLAQLSGIIELFAGKDFSSSWEPSGELWDED